MVESVQRRAKKFILNNYKSNYRDRLISCNLLPLTFRREFLDLVFIYNSYHNLNDCVFENAVKFLDN